MSLDTHTHDGDLRDLAKAPLTELLEIAASIRDKAHGTRVTYSPKVFIPLTMLCRDKCGYCTFAQPPARLESPYLEPEEVLAIARHGASQGCHEALFTLGERPELRYPIAQEWLAERGYDSTVDYLVAMCRLVRDETGLLPHANAGALFEDELAALREVSPSQGMMLESLNEDLLCHRGCPDKEPQRRLQTLSTAGALKIPFTTGLLIGIGESLDDRIEALCAIRDSHNEFGHIQEVIIQNFLPKLGTAMHSSPPCPPDEYLHAIALARLILPSEIHLQAPPNLSDEFGGLLLAGIDDWGGVSPVTADHVNPERPWPDLERLEEVTNAYGFNLAPRLTIHPEFALQPEEWLAEDNRFPVFDRSDAEGLGRDDPGSQMPEKTMENRDAGSGADVLVADENSTQWYSGGANHSPTLLVPGRPMARGAVKEVLDGVLSGQEVGAEQIVTLFEARGTEVAAVAEVANELRHATVGDNVTWVHNRNINYTNVCTFKCRFCGFSKGPLSLNLRGTPYMLTLEDIQERVIEAATLGATEVTLQGGIHPSFDGDYYIDVCKAIQDVVPDMHLHGFTALEVIEGAKRLNESLAEYLIRLKEAGLKSLPGTAAEVLDDEVRDILCPDKISTEEWLECHEAAHSVGLHSNITIMFGSIEQPKHWANHIVRTRDVQKRTQGFTEWIPLPFVHMASPIYLQRQARRGPTFRETLLMHSVGRIAFHGLIDNVQVSWVKIGIEGARQILMAGANDLGGTLMDENISRAAGAQHGQGLVEDDFRRLTKPLGRNLRQRTTSYAAADGKPAVISGPTLTPDNPTDRKLIPVTALGDQI
ncbi:MAG TPA: 7,8-didemethyl-8-hydroxy-5-deazariboflavin synthase [Gemmatimonadetes bacterium]|nr:7,8-didemethyl-8-hydroxy-5-deazariboflavin synthase [Acidimicrobiaceae bacterium]MCH2633390.1 5-amino-6-(D-ribitylamino)uracil--L-tyrosine 4-hydroxyphenyl transferase CofH [Acidimicrobiales bacterium]HAA66543.1 7,8-didemethyl-8-hydroxy-5-deazariboflavin synthase [Acidimicrobiaceae bacterium]HAY76289.1 7,8-didemethyl-8-hydroxy-5-deazariboflavin synthase [Gemmatimonadota bacterium]HCK75384.1 7,8-didemethyl-8-hydroxy-5-deazariboflavin synthase [Acidimicrobiaceae bacterium]